MTTATADYRIDSRAAVKRRQQQTWASGDFHAVATLIQSRSPSALRRGRPAGRLARARRRHRQRQRGDRRRPPRLRRRRHRLRPGAARARPAPRRGRGAARSTCARATPRRSRSRTARFDAVLSVYGSMFAPDHGSAAAELARVCRPGGRSASRPGRPDGFIGEMLQAVAAHVPPPAGVASPILWGTEAYLRELFGDRDRDARRARSGRSRSASARPRRSSTTSAPTTARR